MRGRPIKHPRKIGEHVSRALDFLAQHGAEDMRVWKTKHVIIGFRIGAHEVEVRTSCTPRDEQAAFELLMRDLRHAVAGLPGAVR